VRRREASRRGAVGDDLGALASGAAGQQHGGMISVGDYLSFVDDALNGMVTIVAELGDDLANRRLDVPDSNAPFAVLTHCLGVMEYWVGSLIAGRHIERDRAAEFRATGTVPALVRQTRRARGQLEDDLAGFDPFAPPLALPLAAHLRRCPEDADLPLTRTQGGVLLHVYEELAQHRGQMESCRDVLLAPWAVRV
jgi:hypothetical protein